MTATSSLHLNAMTELSLEVDDATARAVKALMRLRRETPSRWLHEAISTKLGYDVTKVPPMGARDTDDDHEAYEALIDYVLAIE